MACGINSKPIMVTRIKPIPANPEQVCSILNPPRTNLQPIGAHPNPAWPAKYRPRSGETPILRGLGKPPPNKVRCPYLRVRWNFLPKGFVALLRGIGAPPEEVPYGCFSVGYTILHSEGFFGRNFDDVECEDFVSLLCRIDNVQLSRDLLDARVWLGHWFQKLLCKSYFDILNLIYKIWNFYII